MAPGPPAGATELRCQVDHLLTGLRQDLAWLDRSLAEQAASSPESASALRMQMRVRCDGMDEQLQRLAARLGCLRTGPPPR